MCARRCTIRAAAARLRGVPCPYTGATFTTHLVLNSALRTHIGIPDDVSGVIVRSVPKLSNLHGRLQVGALPQIYDLFTRKLRFTTVNVAGIGVWHVPQRNDVISTVDGLAISNDGRVRRDGMSPLDFRVMFSLKLVGESISLVVCVDVLLSLKSYCA
jgi:hypothetical protein